MLTTDKSATIHRVV